MLMYVKDIQDNGKCLQVGDGTNVAFYQSSGMTKHDVERAYDGFWYLKGMVPTPTAEEIAEREAQEAARIAEAQRVPDLEDAVAELGAVVDEETTTNSEAIVDLAEYVAQLEECIAQLEGGK